MHTLTVISTLSSDLDLNYLNVTNVLTPINDWYRLGLQLGVPDYQLNSIEKNYPRDNIRCKSEMLSYWFNNAEESSWVVIANALEKIGHRNLAIEIRGVPSDGMYITMQ